MTQRLWMACGLALLYGCPPPSASGPSDSGTTDGPTATVSNDGSGDAPPSSQPTAAPSGSANRDALANWVGDWQSPSCGARNYPRVISLGKDGSFSAQERVSPCVSPPGGPPIRCVWSGIVNYRGSWQLSGQGVTLSQTASDTPPSNITTASALGWDASQAAPTDAADASCVYQRAAAEPSQPKPAK